MTDIKQYDTGRWRIAVGAVRVIFDDVRRIHTGDFELLQDGEIVGFVDRVPVDNDVMHQLDEIAVTDDYTIKEK